MGATASVVDLCGGGLGLGFPRLVGGLYGFNFPCNVVWRNLEVLWSLWFCATCRVGYLVRTRLVGIAGGSRETGAKGPVIRLLVALLRGARVNHVWAGAARIATMPGCSLL